MTHSKEVAPLGSLGQLLSHMPPELCGNILREVLKKTTITLLVLSKNLKKAGRTFYIGDGPIDLEYLDCSICIPLVHRHSEELTQSWVSLTSLNLTFNRTCPKEQNHIMSSLCDMPNLTRLALYDVLSPDILYSRLEKKTKFTLQYFGSDSAITQGLIKFLGRQTELSECSLRPTSKVPYRMSFQKRAVLALSKVTLLQATAPVLTEPLFDLQSVLRLEFIPDSYSLEDQVRAVNRICHLSPQLESLRLRWDTGKVATFLDVTQFTKIAKSASALRYLQMINVEKNVFEEFVCNALDSKVWSNLETLVWVPPVPWTISDFPDTVSPDGKSIVSHPGRQQVLFPAAPGYHYVDRDFRIHCIGQELLDTFSSLQRFMMWNWHRSGYDVMTRNSIGGHSWTYRTALDEDGWMTA